MDRVITQEVLGMDAQAILEIRPALTAYLHEFDGCFANVRSQRHLATYVAGQLSDLQRKSIEPMADAAGIPPRTLQEFLSVYDEDFCGSSDHTGGSRYGCSSYSGDQAGIDGLFA